MLKDQVSLDHRSNRKPDAGSDEAYASGIVIRSTGSWVYVKTDKEVVKSRMRGRFRLRGKAFTNPVAVGDQVTLRLNADGTGLITAIHERRNHLSRRAAGRSVGHEQVLVSNIDQVWIIQSAILPHPNPGLIDRVLVAAEAQHIRAGIVFNKMDLAFGVALDAVHRLRDLYARLSYAVFLTSAVAPEGVDALSEALKDQISVFTGPSGVGKSTLLNAMEPDLDLRVGKVSLKTRKGRHTTAHAALQLLTGGGGVVDTPGIREFGVLDLEPWELSHHFPEFRRHLASCRFPACTHDHEPGCAVKEAYLDSAITEERYRSYLNILFSIHFGEADVGR